MKRRRFNLGEVITLSVGAIMFFIGICALVYVYNDIMPQTSKLPVTIWGTVSDWVMVVITIITAVLLLLTLKSQKEVQENQAKINKLGMYDIRNKYLPKIVIDQQHLINHYYDIKTLGQINFIIKDHNAQQITIKSTLEFEPYFEGKIYQKENYFCQDISMIPINKNFPFRFDLSLVIKFLESAPANNKSSTDFFPYVEIAFEYHDNFGFKYFNYFVCEYQPFTELVEIRESTIDFL